MAWDSPSLWRALSLYFLYNGAWKSAADNRSYIAYNLLPRILRSDGTDVVLRVTRKRRNCVYNLFKWWRMELPIVVVFRRTLRIRFCVAG